LATDMKEKAKIELDLVEKAKKTIASEKKK
jgi:hypothetical protein